MFVAPGDTVLFATVYQSAGIKETGGSVPLRDAVLTMSQNGLVLATVTHPIGMKTAHGVL